MKFKKRWKILTMRKQKLENIMKKTERGAPERNFPAIAKFTDRNFSEEVKTSLIKATKDGNDRTPI